MLWERLQLLSDGFLCRSVKALDGTGLDFATLSTQKVAILNSAVHELAADGAATIVLGGAALAGVAQRLTPSARFIDCLAAAIDLALAHAHEILTST